MTIEHMITTAVPITDIGLLAKLVYYFILQKHTVPHFWLILRPRATFEVQLRPRHGEKVGNRPYIWIMLVSPGLIFLKNGLPIELIRIMDLWIWLRINIGQ